MRAVDNLTPYQTDCSNSETSFETVSSISTTTHGMHNSHITQELNH